MLPAPSVPVRPYVELSSPGILHSGERFFILHYLPTEAEGGGQCNVWDGTSYDAAIEAADYWERYGTPCNDTVGMD